MQANHSKFIVVLFACLALVGCGGEADSNESTLSPAPTATSTAKPTAPCVPGHQNDCQCDDGAEGKQTCAKDGQSYGDCVCIPKPEAGADSESDAGNDAQPDAGNDADAQNDTGNDAGNDAQSASTLNASLSASNPPGMNLCLGTQTTLLTFDLTNASDTDITVNKLRLHRLGVGNADDLIFGGISGGYIHLGIPDASGYVTFDNMGFTIPAKTTQSLSYWGQIGTSDAQVTHQLAMEIWEANDIALAGNAKVQGAFPIRGNVFTLSSAKCSTLEVRLAPNPVSGTVVKKSQNEDVLGIKLTAGINDVLVKRIPLQCTASLHGTAYSGPDCWKRVTSLAVFDGDNQVGLAQPPDMNSGTALITNMNLLVFNGSTKTLTVKASFAPTASVDEPFDKIAVGVPNDWFDAVDMVYNQNALIVMDPSITPQLTQSPTVFFTVLNSGTISITANGHPASDIVVAGKDSWVPFARYRATGQYETMNIDRISVSSLPGGDNADFLQIGISTGGAIKGAAVMPAGITGSVDIDLVGNAIQVPKDGSTDFEVWAKISPTVSSATVNGAWQGVCRSGHSPALGLSSDKLNGEWTPEYSGKLNARTTGDKSGERIYAAKGAAAGNLMVIRKTKPFVAKQNLANNVLFHGEVELYRAQIGADSAGSVALKQMGFRMDVSSGLSLGNFRLYRGAFQVPLNEYAVTDMAHATDLVVNFTQSGETILFVIVSFTYEDAISGSGNVYSLRATANFTGNGNHVTTKPLTGGVYPFNGMPVGNATLGPPEVGSPFIYHVKNGNGWALGTFIWSDNSEVPHSSASMDWTDDYLVQDLSQSATISN